MSQTDIRASEFQLAPLDIKHITRTLYNSFIVPVHSDRVTFTCHIADDIPGDLMLDKNNITSVYTYIIANAVRFTKDGRIHIHSTAAQNGGPGAPYTVTTIVADTGIGMDSDMINAVFTEGRGMSRTRKRIRAMNGDMKVTSNRGRGSEITLTFTADSARDLNPSLPGSEKNETDNTLDAMPVSLSDSFITLTDVNSDVFAEMEIMETPQHRGVFSRREPRVDEVAVSHDQLQGLNILIVEDVLANQEVLRSLLEPVGCKVSSADDGQEALDLMETQIFDVVLMDIRMPIMNGVEATETIRRTPGPHQNVPIIALTADASAENNAQCLAAGADVFLTKPVIVSELLSSIRFVREKQNNKIQKALTA